MNAEFWKNATPEQKLLWNYARSLIAYTTITPLYFQGAIAGSEFLTYNAGKLYVCLQLGLGGSSVSSTYAQGAVTFYDQANAANLATCNQSACYDSTGAAFSYGFNHLFLKNLFFSRFAQGARITYMKFIGYRLNV